MNAGKRIAYAAGIVAFAIFVVESVENRFFVVLFIAKEFMGAGSFPLIIHKEDFSARQRLALEYALFDKNLKCISLAGIALEIDLAFQTVVDVLFIHRGKAHRQ